MGFSKSSNRAESPATKRYTWSGGEHLSEGKYRFSYYDSEKGENVEVELPFEAWMLENTISIGGGGDGYYYWTNEAAPANYESAGSSLTLHKTTFNQDGSRFSEVIARGTYQQIKEILGKRDRNGKPVLPQDMKFQQNYYFYNPKSKEIECIRMQGAMNSAFISFTNAHKDWGQRKLSFKQKAEPSKTGSIYYYEPEFTAGDPYNEEEMKIMGEKDNIVLDYIKSLFAQGGQNEGVDPTVDQTPKAYDGEQSQEQPEGGDINLTDIPF